MFPEKPLVILLVGPPGAGKGTHAGPLSQHLFFPHISTGDLFREHIRTGTPLGQTAKQFIDQGQLAPDSLALDMLFERISEPDCKKGYILDGFPRTLAQAKALDARLNKNHHQLVVLHIHVPDAAIIERITGRLTCKQCGKPYHKLFDPPASDCCETCKGPLYQRDDDREELVTKRLNAYHQQTQPVLAYFSQNEDVVHQINGLNTKEQVYQDILASLPVFVSM